MKEFHWLARTGYCVDGVVLMLPNALSYTFLYLPSPQSGL